MNFPFFSCPAVVERGSAVFRLPTRTVRMAAPSGVLATLVSRCDGDTPFDVLSGELEKHWKRGDVRRFLSELERQGILVDADSAALANWPLVENPGRGRVQIGTAEMRRVVSEADREVANRGARGFHRPKGLKLGQLLDKRRSTRGFSNAMVPLRKVVAILWATYGVQGRRTPRAADSRWHRTVPSGGALYPLRIHLVNLRAQPGLARGVFAIRFGADGAVALDRLESHVDDAYRAYLDPGLLHNAQCIVVVSGRFARTAAKYGSRSLLYVSLEAGHAAQNALLAATELGVGAIEVGGFLDQSVRTLLGAGPGLAPLTTLVFGSASPQPGSESGAGSGQVEFDWVDLDYAGAKPPFHLGRARFADAKDETESCWGRDRCPLAAYDKAVAELWERHACGSPREVYSARGVDLEGALDPRSIAAYLPRQYARPGFPFAPHSDVRRNAWKDGFEYASGDTVPVLAECVYFRKSLKRNPSGKAYTVATTSGVAAYPDPEGAIRRAVLELIERHVFMTAWLSGRPSPAVRAESLPGSIRSRVAALQALGLRVVVKDLSGPLAPAFLLFAQHERLGFTTVASQAGFDTEAALDHACAELESLVFMRLRHGEPSPITPSAVRTPEDHVDLYARRRYFRRADRLAQASGMQRFSAVGRRSARTWAVLLSRLRATGKRLVCVDMTPAGASLGAGRPALHVYRAIVPGLLPISFGAGTESLGLSEAQSLLEEARTYRIFAGSSVAFPHPFA